MGSTASSTVKKKPVKSKKASVKTSVKTGVKKKSARKVAPKKARSRAAPVKKKRTARKKAAATGKPVRKKVATKKQAARKKATTRAARASSRQVDTTAATGQDDSKSLSWMAAQAASALKAVKANQNERAQVLLAKAEISPAKPVKTHDNTTTPVETELPAASNDSRAVSAPQPARAAAGKAVKPVKAPTGKTRKTPVAATPVKTADKQVVKEVPATAPAGQTAAEETLLVQPPPAAATPTDVKVATVGTEVSDESGDQQPAVLPAAAAIAATTTGNKHSGRPLLIGLVILVAILGIRAWFSGDDTANSVAIHKPATTGQSVAAKATLPDVPTVTGRQPATPATTSRLRTESWSPTARPAWQGQAVAQPAPAAPAVPQGGSYAPVYGYGYYPQQPLRQQRHYYYPAYTRPSYSH